MVAVGPCEIPFRGYVDRVGDEDIKWQWSVRDSPCQICYKYKAKTGWIAKLFGKKSEELTNKHTVVQYQPKIWELEYYDYLFPKCDEVCAKNKAKRPPAQWDQPQPRRKSKYLACGSDKGPCSGKQQLVSLDRKDYLKPCAGKFKFDLKEPFCLNEVCGKMKPPVKDQEENKEFLCLNDLINKQKTSKQTSSKEKDGCD